MMFYKKSIIKSTLNSIVLVLVFFVQIQCDKNFKTNPCNDIFFPKKIKDDTSEISLAFKLGPSENNLGKCKFNHEFNFWRGIQVGDIPIPFLSLKGSIYKLGDIVYFELDSGNVFKYFDFDMYIGQIDPVVFYKYTYNNYSRKYSKLQWSYDLILEEKFWDKEINDSIFKFRFSKINLIIENTDLVLYLSKDYGLVGGYHSSILKNSNEEIFSSIGKIYTEIDKKRIRYYSRSNLL